MSKASDRAWHLQPDAASEPMEPPHPLVAALEGVATKLRWHVDILREWWRRFGMAHKGDEYDPREPPDMDRPHPFHNRELAEFVRLASKLGRSVNNVSGGSGGPKEHWIDYVLKGLVIIGIATLVGVVFSVRDKVTSIDTFITQKDKENEREFTRINDAIRGHEQRLDGLEQQRRHTERDD